MSSDPFGLINVPKSQFQIEYGSPLVLTQSKKPFESSCLTMNWRLEFNWYENCHYKSV